MEFFHTESRATAGFTPLSQCHKEINQKVGLALLSLIILEVKPYEKLSNVVFQTYNVTKSLIKSKEVSSQEKPVINKIRNPNSFPRRCLLSSLHHLKVPPSPNGSNNQSSAGNSPRKSEGGFNISSRNSLTLTVCMKHWNAAFIPFEYVTSLPEYTCTTRRHPFFKRIHTFDDCVFEFPKVDGESSSRHQYPLLDDGQFLKYCYQCYKKLAPKKDIYMYSDNSYCSIECQYKARRLDRKMLKALENMKNDSIPSPPTSDDDEGIFILDLSP